LSPESASPYFNTYPVPAAAALEDPDEGWMAVPGQLLEALSSLASDPCDFWSRVFGDGCSDVYNSELCGLMDLTQNFLSEIALGQANCTEEREEACNITYEVGTV